jgi:hypothetical protein
MGRMMTGYVACLVGLVGCYRGGSFVCDSADQCSANGVLGVCQPDHFCSFADGTCDSGQRYGSSSGTSSGVCVGAMQPDAGGPGSEPMPDARECFGTPLEVCHHPPFEQPLTLPATIDTDQDAQCTFKYTPATGPDLCVMSGSVITVNATTAHGMRGLLLLATDSIVINGALDVSSKRGGQVGAGGDAASCTAAGAGNQDDGGGSGGAGGSFIGKGGDGAMGDTNNNGAPAGPSNGGAAGAVQAAVFVRGGCPGAKGGDGQGGSHGGAASHGGGAVYLIAANTIHVTATGAIYASGSGGNKADDESGGGGGGSGGLVGLDATTLTIDGIIAANGGGGGGGGSNQGPPTDGTDGTTMMFDQRANGGNGGQGQPDSPDGGKGGGLSQANGDTPQPAAGGGSGGGGGVGVVLVHGALTGTQISPAPTAD